MYKRQYLFHLSYRFSYNQATSDFLSHVLVNGTDVILPLHVEPKDVLGAGLQLPTVAGGVVSAGTITSGTNQFLLTSGDQFYRGLTAGDVITFNLEFACQNADQEAAIYEAYMSLKRIKDINT